ncbi:MAG: metallophosphoesterase [Clostridia bacterium]|nr:metallophosphoesterase [Clostridia bacterium]
MNKYWEKLCDIVPTLQNKKVVRATKYRGAPSKERFDPEHPLADAQTFYKEPDRDLVILNLTDMHFADFDYRYWTAFDAEKTMKRLVKTVRPDLITVTGDIVCSDSTVGAIARFTRDMDALGVPWAPIFGNHDDEGNCDLNYLANEMLKSRLCLFKKGDPAFGCGNYVINIAEKTDAGDRIVESLILTDSHHGGFSENQTVFFEKTAEAVNALTGGKAELSVLCHIPTAEYEYLVPHFIDEKNGVWEEGFGGVGEKHESVCCGRDANGNPVDQGGFFEAAKRVRLAHVICGHEHLNDYSAVFEGVRHTYTLKLGMGSGFRREFNGGTVFTVGSGGITSMAQRCVRRGKDRDLWRLKF